MRAASFSRFAIPLLLLFGLVVLFAAGLKHDPRLVPSPLIGKPAPAFELPGLNKQPAKVTPADWHGRVVLVNFFASWCAGCREEHATLLQLSQQGVEIIGVDYKDADKDGADWLARFGNPYRTVAADAKGSAGLDWGVYGVPETFVVSPGGSILYKQIGPMTEQAWREKIAPLVERK